LGPISFVIQENCLGKLFSLKWKHEKKWRQFQRQYFSEFILFYFAFISPKLLLKDTENISKEAER
jgi:hypothetical protein